jgi:starch synthase (maltosyl-transferring)
MHRWPEDFARIASLGFDGVVLAPVFASGRDSSVFLAADHRHLHSALGGGDALAALRQAAQEARAAGLSLLLDLTTDRVDTDAAILRDHPAWRLHDPLAGLPPDPRRAMAPGALLPTPAPEDLRLWWLERLTEWLQAGIAGFRCLDASAGGTFWGELIRSLRQSHPDAVFIAWTQGRSPDEVADLEGCGFDLAASSLPWWDYEAPWWGEEAARLSRVAPLLAMPEAPFARRLAAGFSSRVLAECAAKRAIRFSALTGAAWLLPMGFEFGDLQRMGHGAGQAEAFAELRRNPRLDLQDAVREANAERKRHVAASEPPLLLSGPRAPVAVVLQAAEGRLVLANPSLARPAVVSAAQVVGLLPRPGALPADATDPAGRIALAPGEVLGLAVQDTKPVVLKPEPGARGAKAFAEGRGRRARRRRCRRRLRHAWYEIFPRSQSGDPQAAATAPSTTSSRGCRVSARWASTCCTFRRSTRSARRTARAATTRLTPGPDDVGSPYAIGSEGGHDALHPELGTLEDFRRCRRGVESTGWSWRWTSPSSARPTIRG